MAGVAVLSSFVLVSCTRETGKPTEPTRETRTEMSESDQKKQFVSELTAALQHHAPGRTFDYVDSEFVIRFGDRTPMNLANIFSSWQTTKDPEQKRQLILNAASLPKTMGTAIPEKFDDARPRLLPKVRDLPTKGIAALGAELRGSKAAVSVERSLGDQLRITVVYDGDGYMADVLDYYLPKWQLSADDVFAAAILNLKAQRDSFKNVSPGVYLAAKNDNYDSSRILLAEEIEKFQLKGKPLAFAVNRDFLLITGHEDLHGQQKALELVQGEFEKPYPISVVPLLFDSGRWQTHRLPLDTEVGRAFENLRVQEQAVVYRDQQELLEKLSEARRDDVFVATLNVIDDKERGGFDSYCAWSDGVVSLLPEAGRIAFVSSPATEQNFIQKIFAKKKPWMAEARFEDALKVLGHRMKKLDTVPVRYRVESFPTPDEFNAMGARPMPVKAPQ
jgi:hypothetical protein